MDSVDIDKLKEETYAGLLQGKMPSSEAGVYLDPMRMILFMLVQIYKQLILKR